MNWELPTKSTSWSKAAESLGVQPTSGYERIGKALSSCTGWSDETDLVSGTSLPFRFEELVGRFGQSSFVRTTPPPSLLSFGYIAIIILLFILICWALVCLLEDYNLPATDPQTSKPNRTSLTLMESSMTFSGQLFTKSFQTKSTNISLGTAIPSMETYPIKNFYQENQDPFNLQQSSTDLIQRLKELYKEKQNFKKNLPSFVEDESTEMFLDNGRFKHNFTKLTPEGSDNYTAYKALHRFESKWYTIKKIPMQVNLNGSAIKPSVFKIISSYTELTHPNLLSYITCWVEESKISSKQRALINSNRRDRLLSDYIDYSGEGSFVEESDKPSFADDTEVILQNLQTSSFGQKRDSQQCYLNFFVQMEYCSGISLKKNLKIGRLSEVEVFFLFNEILKGICYLHTNGVVHGSLKPSKVLINGDKVKLADFGIESDISLISELQQINQDDENMSKQNRKRSSIFQLPFEDEGHPSSDVFALGLVLLEMISGPVEGKSSKKLLNELKAGINSESIASLTEDQKDLILELSEADPSFRPSAKEIFRLPSFARWNHSIAKKINSLELA